MHWRQWITVGVVACWVAGCELGANNNDDTTDDSTDDSTTTETEEVTDAGFTESASDVAQSAADFVDLDPGATDAEVQAAVGLLGADAQGVVNGHQTLRSRALEWDGSSLSGEESFDDVSYAVDVDITDTASGGSLIDGTFNLTYSLSGGSLDGDYSVDLTFTGLELDDSGCVSGGGFTLVYDLAIELGGGISTSRDGTIIVAYTACDEFTVEAS